MDDKGAFEGIGVLKNEYFLGINGLREGWPAREGEGSRDVLIGK